MWVLAAKYLRHLTGRREERETENSSSVDYDDPMLQFLLDCVERSTKYVKHCPPFEKGKWAGGELEKLHLNLDVIDRVYHYEFQDYIFNIKHYYLFGRTTYKNKHLYFRVLFVYEVRTSQVAGKLFVTYDAGVFLKSVGAHGCDIEKVWRRMVEDGEQVEEPSEFDLNFPLNWRMCDLPLKYLCYFAVYKNWRKLEIFKNLLPNSLVMNLDQFMKVQDTMGYLEKEAGIVLLS